MKSPLRYFRPFVGSVLLCSVPTFMLYPQEPDPPMLSILPQDVGQSLFIQRLFTEDHVLSYDAVLELIEQIENEDLDETCTSEDWYQICHFLAYLARQGILPSATEAEKAELERDIQELLDSCSEFESKGSSYFLGSDEYRITPAVYYYGGADAVLCKGWAHKQWKNTKRFVKHHKTAVIIGTVIVVAAIVIVATVVVTSSAAAAATAAAAAATAAASEDPFHFKSPRDSTPPFSSMPHDENAESSLENQVALLKTLAAENDLLPSISQRTCPFNEDSARTIGSTLAHEAISFVPSSMPSIPFHPQTLDRVAFAGHGAADTAFATEQSIHYIDPKPLLDDPEECLQKNIMYRQGEYALKQGDYEQAIGHFGKVIEIDPQNSEAYLQRAVAYMEVDEYENSLSDYRMYAAAEMLPQKRAILSNTIDFGIGFGKGLPKGVGESGHQLIEFASEFVTHPIDTSCSVCHAFATLAELACSQEWAALSQSLAPEVCQLIDEWNTLSSRDQGERAGYVFGKYGGDILIPGATAKILSKGVKGAKEVVLAAKNLQIAEQTYALEGLSQASNHSMYFAETAAQIEKAERVAEKTKELVITSKHEGLLRKHGLWESFKKHARAEAFLKPYQGQYLPESQIRELIHQVGFPTFSTPKGIPENYRVKLSNDGAGMKYVHPNDEGTYIRVMPGKPHSPFPHQQKPYISHQKCGANFDKNNKPIDKKAPQAHIPIDEFVFRE